MTGLSSDYNYSGAFSEEIIRLLRIEYDKYLALRPVNNPLGWTDGEDAIIIGAYPQLATRHDKWAKIAELLKGRSNYDVMQRWNSKLYKELDIEDMVERNVTFTMYVILYS